MQTLARVARWQRIGSLALGSIAALSCGWLVSGCEEEETTVEPDTWPAPFVNGSRLRAHVIDGGGDAVVFTGWYDRERETDCVFVDAEDGRLRCLPTMEEARAHYTQSDIVYRDASCTDAVRLVSGAVAQAPAEVLGDPVIVDPCDPSIAQYPVFELGDELALPDNQKFYFHDGGDCLEIGVDATVRKFALGPEVSASEFVGADFIVTYADGDRGGARRIVAEDGASVIVGVVDQTWGDCLLAGVGLDHGPCLPILVAWSIGEFADSACTEAIAYTSDLAPGGQDPSCADPEVIIAADWSGCVTELGLFEVGPRVDGTSYVTDTHGACVALEPNDRHANFELGAPIPEDQFLGLDREPRGAGRLQANYTVSDEGQRFWADAYTFFDTSLGVDCVVTELCDGTEACVPDVQRNNAYFTDDLCTKPVALAYWNADCGQPEPTRTVVGYGCLTDQSVLLLGGQAQLTAVYQLTGADCAPALLDQGPGFVYYDVIGTEPLSTFATLERRIE
ncbi:MAG: hypothetical protein U0271_35495 [Polyangiaceae bacterium]